MLYEIINMSDPYTIEADSLEIAFVACLFIGRGQYSFKPLAEGGIDIPFFIFGGCDKWCTERFGKSLKEIVDSVTEARAAELAACFESCVIGSEADRAAYFDGLNLIDDPAKREIWLEKWLDKRRSSMNDIGGRAYLMAKRLRDGSKNPLVAAPQQVFSAA